MASVEEFINQCSEKQKKLLHEHEELGVAIRLAQSMRNGASMKEAKECDAIPSSPAALAATMTVVRKPRKKQRRRVPLVERKQSLVELLKQKGPMRRSAILKELQMPNGTLATLLQDGTFAKSADGTFGLKEGVPA